MKAILREVALSGKIQSRGDGAGSEANGTTPQSTAPPVARSGGFGFWEQLLWWSFGAEALDKSSATLPGRFVPASILNY